MRVCYAYFSVVAASSSVIFCYCFMCLHVCPMCCVYMCCRIFYLSVYDQYVVRSVRVRQTIWEKECVRVYVCVCVCFTL